jgi:hypothetical protein
VDIKEIDSALTSKDVDLLRHCLGYMDGLTAEERTRGQRAEDKAQAILNLSGIGATIVAGFIGLFYQTPPTLPNLLLIIYGGSLGVMLVKSINYSLKTVQPLQGYQANETFVFDVQGELYAEALRQELVAKLWLYQQNVSVVTRKLFYLHRAVRNLAAFITVFLFLSFVSLFLRINPDLAQHHILYVVGFVLFCSSLLLDYVVEERSVLWSREQNVASNSNGGGA